MIQAADDGSPASLWESGGVLAVRQPTSFGSSTSLHLFIVRTSATVAAVVARVDGGRSDGMAPVGGWAALLVEAAEGGRITVGASGHDGEPLAELVIPVGHPPPGRPRCLGEAP